MEKQEFNIRNSENIQFTISAEIKEGRLSMSADYGRGGGQCLDEIKPKNKEQRRLIEIWKTWHLNDMHAGTEKQEAILKELKKKDPSYEDKVAFLKKRRAYTDNGYKYGTGWLARSLPDGLEEELKQLCNTLRQQEAERKASLEGGKMEDLPKRVQALALSLDISAKEAEEDIEEGYTDDSILEYAGISYFVGTEKEAEEKARDYLDVDLWKQAVENDNTESSFEEWQDEVIKIDGFGHILNSWDGTEDTQEVDGVTYYVIRM